MNEYLYWIFERRKVQGIQLILYSVPFEWSKKPRGWSGSDLFCCIHFVSHSCNPYSEWFNVCGYSFRYSQYSQSYGFSSGHLWMWELDSKERWAPKTWCFWTVVLEKTLERPLDCKEIQPVHSEGDQPWDFFGEGMMLKLKLQYFGHIMRRVDSLEKTLMLEGIGGRRRRGRQRMRWLNGITDWWM